ncbi:MAG TPA: sigma 54-interacting transcriptional regulator, partial [Nannocystaceae bacterium]|nr:sigma 54-interacting transcriptional regulator [Nannocystaceae bacterium]
MERRKNHGGRARRGEVDQDTVLMAVGELVGSQIDLDALLAQVMDTVTEAMAADRGTFFLVDRQRGEVFSKAGYYPEIGEIRLALGQGIAGHVARTGATVILDGSADDPRVHRAIDRATGYATRSILCVPVRDRAGEILGVIELLNKQGAAFDERDAALLRALASQVAMVVETTSLYAQLRAPSSAPLAYRYNGIVGQSEAMTRIYDVVARAAATDATVLVTGETGTGKGLCARAIHHNSARRARPFVAVDCAALPATLIENELFGHERGAYTGADQRSIGKFEAADGGTVFLDEIGDVNPKMQAQLLRVLQEGEIRRVGGGEPVEVDARVVAATNRDLEDEVRAGRFREDLYFRLNVVNLRLPPLRDRRSDVKILAEHFLSKYAAREKREMLGVAPDAMAALERYAWPGNVRELE